METTEDRRKCRRTGERSLFFPEERFITRQPNEGDERRNGETNTNTGFVFLVPPPPRFERATSISFPLPPLPSPPRQPPRTFPATFPLPRRSFSSPLERDSTKDRAFVLTNPPVRVRRLVDGPSFLASSFPVCERRSSGDPSTLHALRPSARSVLFRRTEPMSRLRA